MMPVMATCQLLGLLLIRHHYQGRSDEPTPVSSHRLSRVMELEGGNITAYRSDKIRREPHRLCHEADHIMRAQIHQGCVKDASLKAAVGSRAHWLRCLPTNAILNMKMYFISRVFIPEQSLFLPLSP